MKTVQNSDTFQKFMRFGTQATGHGVAIGVAVALVLAWALTGPLFQLGERIARGRKLKVKN